jgi:hypothetical protein
MAHVHGQDPGRRCAHIASEVGNAPSYEDEGGAPVRVLCVIHAARCRGENGVVLRNIVLEGDRLQVLRGLPDNCVDAEPYPIDHTCAPRPDSQATPAPRGAH